MKNLKLLLGIILGFVTLLGCLLFGDYLVGMFITTEPLVGLCELAIRLILMFISYFIIKKMYKKNIGPSATNMTKGLFGYGATMWIIIILNLIFDYKTPTVPITSAIPAMIGMFFSMMGTGVLEELAFRGFFFNAFLDRLGNTKKGVFASMMLSSSVFGLIHLINLIDHPELIISTSAQVIYAIMIGCFFCIVYYRTKNIWPVIILHGLVDFTGKFWHILNTAPKVDGSLLDGVIEVGVCVILFVAAIIQLNKEFEEKEDSPAGENNHNADEIVC